MYGIGLNGSLLMGAQALNTQQQAIQTIGNNISNVNTAGYVRERANLTESTTVMTASGEQGTGVSVSNIESLRDSLLDGLVQQSLGSQGYADDQSSLTTTVQTALGENFSSASTSGSASTTSSGAIQTAMSNFFSSLQSLEASPSDSTTRQEVVQDASTLTTALNDAYTRIQDTQSQIATDASSITSQINQLSTSIATLNQQITAVQSASGGSANELTDERSEDISQLSSLVNVTATAQSNGSVTVALADAPSVVLVSGNNGGGAGTTQSLSVSYDPTSSTPLTVSGSTSGALGAGIPSSGSLGSHLEVANTMIGAPAADGGTGLLAQMDNVATSLMTQMNDANEAGYDLNGAAGTAFFTGTGAGDIAVASNIASNPSLIAAASTSGAPLDGSNAATMADIQNSSSVLPAFENIVSGVGQTVATAATNQTTQDQVTTQLQDQQNSVEGVSIDEEMTNLISFQQAYSASARFVTTIAGLYDTLIAATQSS
jgi:flagellar hook-associated protein 1 FlgK